MKREEIAAHVGDQLLTARVIAQVSLRELGSKSNLTAANISLIEQGRVLPPLDTLYRLCEALGVDPLSVLPRASSNGAHG